jgi:hypothetical protein
MTPIALKAGDPCPACGGELKPARVPTDAEFARAFDKENPVALAPGVDTAPAAQRDAIGVLYRCVTCRYQARFTDAGEKPPERAARKTS